MPEPPTATSSTCRGWGRGSRMGSGCLDRHHVNNGNTGSRQTCQGSQPGLQHCTGLPQIVCHVSAWCGFSWEYPGVWQGTKCVHLSKPSPVAQTIMVANKTHFFSSYRILSVKTIWCENMLLMLHLKVPWLRGKFFSEIPCLWKSREALQSPQNPDSVPRSDSSAQTIQSHGLLCIATGAFLQFT